jgi:hypothetical protein
MGGAGGFYLTFAVDCGIVYVCIKFFLELSYSLSASLFIHWLDSTENLGSKKKTVFLKKHLTKV